MSGGMSPVRQGGPVNAGSVAVWSADGYLADGGAAGGISPLASIRVSTSSPTNQPIIIPPGSYFTGALYLLMGRPLTKPVNDGSWTLNDAPSGGGNQLAGGNYFFTATNDDMQSSQTFPLLFNGPTLYFFNTSPSSTNTTVQLVLYAQTWTPG